MTSVYSYDDFGNRINATKLANFTSLGFFSFYPTVLFSGDKVNLFGRNLPAGRVAARGILVTINGVAAPIYRAAPNVITVEVPEGASSGAVVVTLPGKAPVNLGNLAILADDEDQDGLSFKWEVALGLDPNSPDSDKDGLSDGGEDSDGDGLANAAELNAPPEKRSNPAKKDSDGDLLADAAELAQLTMPLNADTDGDGFLDGEEVQFGANPLDPASMPANPDARIGEAWGAVFAVLNAGDPTQAFPTEAWGAVFSIINQSDPSGPPIGEAFGPAFTIKNH